MSPEMTVLLFLNLQILTTVNEPSSETGKKAKVGEGGHSPFGMDPVQGQRGCGEGMEPSKGGGDPDPGFVRMGGRSLENLLLDGFGKTDEISSSNGPAKPQEQRSGRWTMWMSGFSTGVRVCLGCP